MMNNISKFKKNKLDQVKSKNEFEKFIKPDKLDKTPGKLKIYRKSDGKVISVNCVKWEINNIIDLYCSYDNILGVDNLIKYEWNGNTFYSL